MSIKNLKIWQFYFWRRKRIMNCSNLRPFWNGCIIFTVFVLKAKQCRISYVKGEKKTRCWERRAPAVGRPSLSLADGSVSHAMTSCGHCVWGSTRKKLNISDFIKHLDTIEKFNVTGVNINAFQRPGSKGTLLFRHFLNSLMAKFGQKNVMWPKSVMWSSVFSARLNSFLVVCSFCC